MLGHQCRRRYSFPNPLTFKSPGDVLYTAYVRTSVRGTRLALCVECLPLGHSLRSTIPAGGQEQRMDESRDR